MILNKNLILDFCFVVSACVSVPENNQTYATGQANNQPINVEISKKFDNSIEQKINGVNGEQDNKGRQGTQEEQAVKEIAQEAQDSANQLAKFENERIESYVKELDEKLKSYKSYESKLRALDRAESHIFNSHYYKSELSIEEYHNRKFAIAIKRCDINVELLYVSRGLKIDKKAVRECHNYDNSNKPADTWGFH